MAFDRRDILTYTADKIMVRDFVGKRVNSRILTDSYGIYASADEIDWSLIPEEFVAKVNHGCGGNVIVWKGAPETGLLPKQPNKHGWNHVLVHPDNFNRGDFKRLVQYWLSQNYSWGLGRKYPEWVYKNIQPGLIFEELLLSSDGKPPNDYKFFCFNGKVAFVENDVDRFSEHRTSVMTTDWKEVDVHYSYPRMSKLPPRPKMLDEMIRIAGALSDGFDFVRVDLYEIGDDVKFGELTHYPTGGNIKFTPNVFDEILSHHWEVPQYSAFDPSTHF